jgi:hypothetical protein
LDDRREQRVDYRAVARRRIHRGIDIRHESRACLAGKRRRLESHACHWLRQCFVKRRRIAGAASRAHISLRSKCGSWKVG